MRCGQNRYAGRGPYVGSGQGGSPGMLSVPAPLRFRKGTMKAPSMGWYPTLGARCPS